MTDDIQDFRKQALMSYLNTHGMNINSLCVKLGRKSSFFYEMYRGKRAFREALAESLEKEFVKHGLPPIHLKSPPRDGIPSLQPRSDKWPVKSFPVIEVETSNGVEFSDPENADETNYRIRKRRIPVVGTAQLGPDGYWTETNHPPGSGDGFIDMESADDNAYAVRVIGDSMHPRIKSGEYVIVWPSHSYVAGDEVLVVTRDGRSMVKEFVFNRDGMVALHSVNDAHGRMNIPASDIEKIHYVAAFAKSALYRPE